MIEEINKDSEAIKNHTVDSKFLEKSNHLKKVLNKKRNIIRFNGENPEAINLEHAVSIFLKENSLKIEFALREKIFNFETKEIAKEAFEIMLNEWVSE